MSNILIGSPIKQKPNVLKEFLNGLDEIEVGYNKITFIFVDDNIENDSSLLLEDFSKKHNTIIIKGESLYNNSSFGNSEYYNHLWQTEGIVKITEYKNKMIEYCIQNHFDYLFLIDSDIVVNSKVLTQLISDNVDIVSNVFWTQWSVNGSLLPQCFWIPDIFQQFKSFNQPLTTEEAMRKKEDLIEKLKKPGLYKVDGLGACTLIKREALEKGVSFKEIPNLSLPGEDRHFCMRAGALGIELYIDTVYPAYHVFREEYLSRVDEFKKDGFKFDMCQTFTETEEAVTQKSFIDRLKNKTVKLLKKFIRKLEQ